MAVYYGKKLIHYHPDSPGLLPALTKALGSFELGGYHFTVVIAEGIRFVIEDTPTEWRLCPIMKELKNNMQVNFDLYRAIPKPST